MSTTASASPPMQELSGEEAGFHERQVLMHCAMHTLNSLVGERWVTVGLLASIARDLEVKHRMESEFLPVSSPQQQQQQQHRTFFAVPVFAGAPSPPPPPPPPTMGPPAHGEYPPSPHSMPAIDAWSPPAHTDPAISPNAASRPSLFNPYYHWAGPWVGNWDIMVIIEALKARGMEVAHHLIFNPKRPENLVSELEAIRRLVDEPTTVGIIVNERSQNWLMKFISGHHWYAMVPIRHPEVQASIEPHIEDQRAQWVNKDSKLTRPQLVGDLGTTPELLAFLNQQVQERAAQVFVIRRTPQVAASTQQHHAPTAPTCAYPAPSESEEVLPDVPSPSQLSSHSVATDSPRTSFGERPLFPSPPS
mmetsp:Transcript_11207/g.32209  ORF Transcript_11207/g.32209 Transcript_11207/m.32209 type:complete len:362 (-) Transcript_11207:28-1113(-)